MILHYCAELAQCDKAKTSEQAFAITTIFNQTASIKQDNFEFKEMLTSADEAPLINAMFCQFV